MLTLEGFDDGSTPELYACASGIAARVGEAHDLANDSHEVVLQTRGSDGSKESIVIPDGAYLTPSHEEPHSLEVGILNRVGDQISRHKITTIAASVGLTLLTAGTGITIRRIHKHRS